MAVSDPKLHPRAVTIRVLFVLVGLLLLGKAFHLQVVSSKWTERAARVGESKEKLFPARGLIADRNGKLLTVNEPVYQIEMTYNQFARQQESFDTLAFCELLGISRDYFENAIPKRWAPKYSRSKPFVFLPNVAPRDYARIQENLFRFPGFTASLRSSRSYPQPFAAHLLGYLGEVDQQAIDGGAGRYERGEYHGISGLEYRYEEMLRGEKGERWLYRDRLGRVVGQSGSELEATVGSNLITTIDLELQRYGEELMANKVGAIIAIEPKSGEILTMISAPTYNPQYLQIGKYRSNNFRALQRDSLQPLLNRAVNGKYPPGSPFKTLVALIGMETGTLKPGRGIACNGGFYSNGKMLMGCHAHPYCNNVEQAIAQSCNNYFVTTWLEMINRNGALSPTETYTQFNDYLHQFGLGRKLGVDFPGEIGGFIPPASFYEEGAFKDEQYWRATWIRNLAIGQGEYEMTSLQIANFIAAIANRGYWYTPHLVKQVQEGNEQITRPVKIERHDIDIAPEHFETVVRGMRKTVTSGTARRADALGLTICGKTGTVQNRYGDHSVFTAFAPQDDPEIAILVYVENGGYGGTIAAPIASLMIEKHLNDSIAPNRRWLEQRILETDMTKRGESTIREVK